MIEDNLADIETFKRGISPLDISIDFKIKRDGKSARDLLEKLDNDDVCGFDLVLLDLNLPGIDGRTLLKRYFKRSMLGPVPLVVISTSADEKDIEFAYKNGANAYVVKPGDGIKFLKYIKSIINFWLD
ncbi:MAG: response regulator [bacterium]